MDLPEAKSEAKMDFISFVGSLMPGGNPVYSDVIKYSMIKSHVLEHVKKTILKVFNRSFPYLHIKTL